MQNAQVILIYGAFLVVLFLMIIVPKRRAQKKNDTMRNNLQIGDEIVTIGGLIGKITKITDDEFIIETGADKTRIRIKKWAVGGLNEEPVKTAKGKE